MYRWSRVAVGMLLASCITCTVARAGNPACGPWLAPARATILLPIEAPQAVAVDRRSENANDRTRIWIASGLSNTIAEVAGAGSRFEIARTFDVDLDGPQGFTGLAYDARHETLFVLAPRPREIVEVDLDGQPTGVRIELRLPRPPNIIPEPFPRGLAFDPSGDGASGTWWLIDSVMTGDLRSGGRW